MRMEGNFSLVVATMNDSLIIHMVYLCDKKNVRVRNDNTKHQFMPLLNDYLDTCIKILQSIGLTEKLHIDADGNVLEFKSSIAFSHSYQHVPPTKTTNDINISPVRGYIFAV